MSKALQKSWPMVPIGGLLKRVQRPVDVRHDVAYREIGIRSHCKGIFYKQPTTGALIGSKRVFWVEPGCLIFNIVFAWEQAVAWTRDSEVGMIASHRFPMYTSRNGKLLPEYAWRYFSSARGKYDLQIASPGGAGRNKTLGQEAFMRLRMPVPPIDCQRKALEALAAADRAIQGTEQVIETKRKLKMGLAQQLLTGQRRLPGFTHKWKTHRLGTLFRERRESGYTDLPLLSVTRRYGVVHHGEANRKDSSADDKSNYKRIAPGDIGYNTMRMWQGISALSQIEGIVSPAYTICSPGPEISGEFASHLFKLPRIIYHFYQYSQGMVSDTWNLKYRHFAQIPITIPTIQEQMRIAAILGAADRELELSEKKLAAMRELKEGLMQSLVAMPAPTISADGGINRG